MKNLCVRKIALSGAILFAMSGCATAPTRPRIDNVPMYGQPEVFRPEPWKKMDEEFIAQAVAGIGNRERASEVWWAQAEDFMREGNLDFAMRRYNQAWLLNPSNYQPYWGFGRVTLRQGKCNEALLHFAKAKALATDKHQKAALLADFGIAYGYCARVMPADQREARLKYFDLANRQFTDSTGLDPNYSNAWFRWSQLLLEEDKPIEAWAKLKRAKETGAQIPDAYLQRLTQRLPEPK